ncbi:MAG: hypothetical protein V3U52_03145 [Thermoplasmata archaeon]
MGAPEDDERMETDSRHSTGTVLVFCTVLLLSSITMVIGVSQAQESPFMRLSLEIFGEGNPDDTLALRPDRILIASVPILINVTFIHNDTVNPEIPHNFRTEIDEEVYKTPNIFFGESISVEFWINETGEIPYWCDIPGHRDPLGMEGVFVVGFVEEEPSGPQGVALRAYWIGLIGIFSMVIVIIISYFVIKSESRHHTDHREHRRKGLP